MRAGKGRRYEGFDMSASQFDEFDRRMRRISRRHSKLSHGYVTTVNDDGMVVAKPKRRSRAGLFKALVILALVLIIFKGVLHSRLGADAYQARIDSLAAGSAVEQAGAWLMTADPTTLGISDFISSLVR